MADLLYIERKMCGCVRQLAMVNDNDPKDIADYAELIARLNAGDKLILCMERRVWNGVVRCDKHGPQIAEAPR